MKKFILLAILAFSLFIASDSEAINIWKTCLTGGTSDCLDNVDGDDITEPSIALVFVDQGANVTWLHIYRYYASSAAENSPLVIAPDTNPGTKRWHLVGLNSVAFEGTVTLTTKTIDTDSNTVKQTKYYVFTSPKSCDETGALIDTTKTNSTFGFCKMGNAADKAGNYAEYLATVPADIDTSVDLKLTSFTIGLGGADTAAHVYEISHCNPAASAAWNCVPGNAVAISVAADAAGASGDVEYAASLPITLTDWKSNVTAGRVWKIRVARDGDAAGDASTVDSYILGFVISYKSTL